MKKNFLKKRFNLVIAVVIFLALGVSLAVLLKNKPEIVVPEIKETAKLWYSKLDGTLVENETEQTPVALAVMIDNHPEARQQQSSLSEARVVYEALAEGGITRYMAVFAADDKIVKVGPVRSARPYFLDWVREYGNSTYWHSGGSPEALKMISQYSLASTNEFSNGQYYWRDRNYFAPHNLFTNEDRWAKYLLKRNAPEKEWNGWLFETSTVATSTPSVNGVTIKYSSDYRVTWKFDGKNYLRAINGKDHKDGIKQLLADTVIVQEVPTKIIDDVGRKDIETVGKGTVKIFEHGLMIRGKWEKKSVTDRTRFYDDTGKEISLAPGKIWIQIVPLNTSLEITS